MAALGAGQRSLSSTVEIRFKPATLAALAEPPMKDLRGLFDQVAPAFEMEASVVSSLKERRHAPRVPVDLLCSLPCLASTGPLALQEDEGDSWRSRDETFRSYAGTLHRQLVDDVRHATNLSPVGDQNGLSARLSP